MESEGDGKIVSDLDGLLAGLSEIQRKIAQMESQIGEIKSQIDGALKTSQATSGVDLSFVNHALQRLVIGKTQEQILENYLREAQTRVGRAILFLGKEAQYVPWKSLGFPFETIEAISAGDPNDPIIRAAAQKRIIYRAEAVDQLLPWLRDAGKLPRCFVCIPLVFADFVPIVFYGDCNEEIDIDSLETLSHLAVLVLKNNYLQNLVAAEPEFVALPQPVPSAPAPQPSPFPPTPVLVQAEQKPEFSFTHVAPETDLDFESEVSSEQEEEFDTAQEGVGDELDTLRWSSLAETAAIKADEPPVAQRTPEPTVPPAVEPVSIPQPAYRTEQEEKHHNEARRFARLLVSEIKLYNEEKVYDGRQNKDLYPRLKLDVDKSREMYERRVDPQVASTADYFHEEIVRILAKGDESLLGSDYPGPMLRP